MGEFAEVQFSELLAEPLRNGVYKPKEFHGRGVKIVNMGELFAHPRLRAISMKRVELTKKELERSSIVSGDLIFARRSLTAEGAGKCALVLETDEPTTFESSIIRARINPRRANAQYLYYLFNSPVGVHRLDTIRRQVAVAGITGSDLAGLKLPIPDRRAQDLVCAILSALDDKIDLNQQINETLEALARAVFKDWFVDFGPTRAKMEGRAPYLAPDLWALFPDRLDEDGKPEGWESVPLLQLTTKIGSGATPSGGKRVYVDDGVSFIRSQNVYDFRFTWDGLARITDDDAYRLRGVSVVEGDVLINITGDSILRTCVVDPEVLPARVNQHVAIVRPRPGIPPLFLHLSLIQPRSKALLLGHDAGGSRAAITKGHLEEFSTTVPAQALLDRFHELAAPWLARVNRNNAESRTLGQTRDLLLPKLMSGEVSLKDAETAAGKAL